MQIYLVIFFVHLLLHRVNSRLLLIASFVTLTFICGFRDISVGTDTLNYSLAYEMVSNDYGGRYEPIFTLLVKINALLGGTFRSFLILYSALTLIPIYYIATKASKMPLLMILIYIGLFYYFYSFNIMRQVLSVSWSGLAIFLLFESKKIGKWTILSSLVCLAIGISAHYSSVIVIPCILLTTFLMKQKNDFVLYSLIFVSFLFGTVFFNVLTVIGARIYGYSVIQSNASFFGNLVLSCIQIFLLIFLGNIKEEKGYKYYLFAVFVILYCLVVKLPYNYRLFLPMIIANLLFLNEVVADNRIIRSQKSIVFLLVISYVGFTFLNALFSNYGEIVPYIFSFE